MVNSREESHVKILWGHASVDVSVQSFARLFAGRTAPISALVLTVNLRLPDPTVDGIVDHFRAPLD